MMPFAIITGVVLGAGLLLLLMLRGRGGKLTESGKTRVLKQWQQACSLDDAHRRVLEGDKVLDALLGELGFRGTLGEKLKSATSIIPDINAVWSAHKLRNRIAHEPGIAITDRQAQNAMDAFGKVIRKYTA